MTSTTQAATTATINEATKPAEVALLPAPIPATEMKVTTFNFKADKKLGTPKRPPLMLQVPYPTLERVIDALSDEKQAAYILSLINDDVTKAVRDQINDETKPVDSQDKIDYSKLDLTFLANQPAGERRGGGIAKETWEAFSANYIEIMPAVTGKNPEQVQNAATLFAKRLAPVKTHKPTLQVLLDQLNLWFANTKDQEEFQEVYEFLSSKADTLLKTDDAELLKNL